MFKYQTMLAKFIDLTGSLDERLVFAGPNATGVAPKLPIMKAADQLTRDAMAAELGDDYILWSELKVS